MADHAGQSPSRAPADRALEQVVDAHAAQTRELARLSEAILATAQENLRLHGRALEAVQTLRAEMERLKRVLKALGTAR